MSILATMIKNGYEYDEDGVIRKKECDFPGCDLIGEYPAPKGEESENLTKPEQWLWFCLEHVRLFNTAWDFGQQMSPEELAKWRQKDEIYHRPSWPFSSNMPKDWSHFKYEDPFNLFSESTQAPSQALDTDLSDALKLLGLSHPYSDEELKQKYRILAKKYHPDLNSNNPIAEERLKGINQAYRILRKGKK